MALIDLLRAGRDDRLARRIPRQVDHGQLRLLAPLGLLVGRRGGRKEQRRVHREIIEPHRAAPRPNRHVAECFARVGHPEDLLTRHGERDLAVRAADHHVEGLAVPHGLRRLALILLPRKERAALKHFALSALDAEMVVPADHDRHGGALEIIDRQPQPDRHLVADGRLVAVKQRRGMAQHHRVPLFLPRHALSGRAQPDRLAVLHEHRFRRRAAPRRQANRNRNHCLQPKSLHFFSVLPASRPCGLRKLTYRLEAADAILCQLKPAHRPCILTNSIPCDRRAQETHSPTHRL